MRYAFYRPALPCQTRRDKTKSKLRATCSGPKHPALRFTLNSSIRTVPYSTQASTQEYLQCPAPTPPANSIIRPFSWSSFVHIFVVAGFFSLSPPYYTFTYTIFSFTDTYTSHHPCSPLPLIIPSVVAFVTCRHDLSPRASLHPAILPVLRDNSDSNYLFNSTQLCSALLTICTTLYHHE